MNNETNNNWKSYVDWWPSYIMIGIALGYFIDETGIVQKCAEKIFKKEEE